VQAEYDALTRHGLVAELAEADAIRRAWDKYPPKLWVPPKPPATGPTTKPAAKAGATGAGVPATTPAGPAVQAVKRSSK
jgi:hypothetical protein